MKKIKFLFFLAATTSMFVYSSCNKLEEAATIKVPVPDFSIDIPAIVTPSGPEASSLRGSDGLNQFSGSATLDINDDIFKDLKKNRDVLSLVIGTVNITVNSSGGTVAKDIRLSATGGAGNFTIEEYTFGSAFRSEALGTYATNLFKKFIEVGQIEVSVTGYTDVQAGDELAFSLNFGDIRIEAQLIKF